MKRPITIERTGKDYLVPKDFFEILTRRLLPVISLTYVSSVIGIAAEDGQHFIHYLFEDKSAYLMALLVVLWVSFPAILWILLKGSHLYSHLADLWYKICAALMMILLGMSYILFPEAGMYGLRTYFVASVPILVVLYCFFIRGGLPPLAAHPLTALGATFLIYGAIINFIH